MFFFDNVLTGLVLWVGVLISVAFVTLLEQKILGSCQSRQGPVYVGWLGIMQPFSDAVKLLSKENLILSDFVMVGFFISPILGLSLSMFGWIIFPFFSGGLGLKYSVLFFFLISSLMVYPIMLSGWMSNNKYGLMGGLRSVAQMISYEVSFCLVIVMFLWLSGVMGVSELCNRQFYSWNFFVLFPLGYVWLLIVLAELNRSPFDFSEGESELVSGFNVEYMSGGFVLIFMAEYLSLIFMSVMSSVFMLGGVMGILGLLKVMFVVILVIWFRGFLPRYRYDKLMELGWGSVLVSLFFLFFYYLSLDLFM